MTQKYDYARPKLSASRLIAKFGSRGALLPGGTVDVGLTGDPWNPITDTSGPSTVSLPCDVVITNYTVMERASTSVQVNDRKALVSTKGLTVEPRPGMTLVVGDIGYSIVNVEPTDPGGVVLMYEMQVRR